MAGPRSRRSEVLLFVVVVAAAAAVIVGVSLALRSSGATSTAQTASAVAGPSPATSQAPATPAAEPQICASCWGDGGPDPTVRGEAEVAGGVQVVEVGLEDGYYVPNEFTVQAGLPVTVVFTGSAEGCLAEPEFPDLGVEADFSGGSATVELGVLEPGSYQFTCSMGVNQGHVTVE